MKTCDGAQAEDALDDAVMAVLVKPGWERSVLVPQPNGLSYRVLFYEDSTARFEHRCDRGDRGVVICAPAMQLDNGHTILQADPLTISPSILCPDCGTHGFIRDGRWVGE